MNNSISMTKHVSKYLAIAGIAVLGLVCIAVLPLFSRAEAQLPYQVPTSSTEITLTFAPLVKQASPAVVNVYTKKTVQRRTSPFDSMFGRSGAPSSKRVQNSLGSGVIVGSDGVIVTNNHVIEGADEFQVVLSDRREYTAELVLADKRTDLAVLKIDTGGELLPTLAYADTRDVEVGDLVLAIGNPFGVGQTVTSGIISATARTDVGVSDFAFFLQTDAAVNPGNSGGALIGVNGQLVGVNTAIFSRSGGSNGIGFAIPSEMVKRVVDAAVNEGTLVRPWLGLTGQTVSFDIAKTQGLTRPVGIIITEVYKGGPVDAAGLRRGDVVTAIDGREVYDEIGLKFLTAVKSPGDSVNLDVLRSGRKMNVRARLSAPPGALNTDLVLLDGRHPFSGAQVAEMSPRLAEESGLDPIAQGTGLYVYRVYRGSIARNFIRPGDLILKVDGRRVLTVSDLKKAVAGGKASWLIEVERNGRRVSGTVRL